MLKDKTFWKIHLKWGVIAGIMLAGIEILKMFARKVDYQAAQLHLVVYGVILLGLYLKVHTASKLGQLLIITNDTEHVTRQQHIICRRYVDMYAATLYAADMHAEALTEIEFSQRLACPQGVSG